MNGVAHLPDTCLYFMQQQNIQKRVSKTIRELDSEDTSAKTEDDQVEEIAEEE